MRVTRQISCVGCREPRITISMSRDEAREFYRGHLPKDGSFGKRLDDRLREALDKLDAEVPA